ncbi:MAG: hypothetical protein R2710_27795 [Acidimicrobiales bacterium]
MVIVTVWQMSGCHLMIAYVTALMSIDESLLEASLIDGATGFKQMLYVKIPLIVPAFTISLFLTIRNALMVYDLNLADRWRPVPDHRTRLDAGIQRGVPARQLGQGAGRGRHAIIVIAIAAVIQWASPSDSRFKHERHDRPDRTHRSNPCGSAEEEVLGRRVLGLMAIVLRCAYAFPFAMVILNSVKERRTVISDPLGVPLTVQVGQLHRGHRQAAIGRPS